jgi:hypothetical protein
MRPGPIVLQQLDNHGVIALIAQALSSRGALPKAERSRRDSPSKIGEAKRSLFDRIDGWVSRKHRDYIEATLATASDVYELERRIRDIESGTLYRNY